MKMHTSRMHTIFPVWLSQVTNFSPGLALLDAGKLEKGRSRPFLLPKSIKEGKVGIVEG